MEIAIITNVLTSYREGFLDLLFAQKGINVKIYCQETIPGMNLKSIHKKYGDRVHIVNNFTANGEKIGFQLLPINKILSESDVIFLDGNPRIISNIVMGLTPIVSSKKFVMWTMAHSFGANQITEKIRLKWTSLFKNIFVYTDEEIKYLRDKGFKRQHIMAMNNGLNQNKIDEEKHNWDDSKLQTWLLDKELVGKKVAVSIARLTTKNKFEQVIEALPEVIKIYPDFVWCLIGSGVEEDRLKGLAEKLGVSDHIKFIGALFSEKDIAPYMLSAKIFLHPASIGLSLMHAFGYGLPVIVNDEKEMHGPEYGIFKDTITGMNFEKNNINDLARKINYLLVNGEEREKIGENNLRLVREKYNVNVMVKRFIEMAKTAK